MYKISYYLAWVESSQLLAPMALSFPWRHWCSAIALISMSFSLSYAEKEGDPFQIAAKALLCFNDHLKIYKNCDEAYRLSESGDLHVPYHATDEFCSGPCYAETELVLKCINGVLDHFFFYNKATVEDVRKTIHAACSYTNERGNFDVDSYLDGEYSAASHKICHPFSMLMAMVGGSLMLI